MEVLPRGPAQPARFHVHQHRVGVGRIERGLLVFLGIARGDSKSHCKSLIDKIHGLRIFSNPEGKFDLSVQDIGGSLLVVSQFTLMGDASKGRRPSFQNAAPRDEARTLYEYFLEELDSRGISHAKGQFQASMQVSLCNDGPVTLMLEV